jgi:predicted  nucleic acid-binding Zn-ribbon protein
MKASPADQALLLDLQALDTRLQQLDHRAKSLPEHASIAEFTAKINALRSVAAEQSGQREDVTIELKRLESDVEVVQARAKRDADRLATSSSVKDVAALEQELAALKKRQFDLEEIELTVMEKLEQRDAALAATSAQIEELQASVAEVVTARDAVLVTVTAERNNAAANRRTIESKVPADLLALYEKQRARYGFGASLLQYGTSKASGVKLLENDMQTIRATAPDEVILCPISDAILVRTSESGL